MTVDRGHSPGVRVTLADRVNTFGQAMLRKYGERVHKIAIDAGFTCPNRDGSKGRGGCTFCNNVSFSPNERKPPSIPEQIEAGRRVIVKRTGAKKYIAYFQTYSNTYADINTLRSLYESALAEPDVIGLSIGTRPDCVAPAALDLLASYRDQGYEIWLELGLQSAFDDTLARVNRGHGLKEYEQAVHDARSRELNICTHLIVGLPGETDLHIQKSLRTVLLLGVQGLKIHPLHVVKGTQLANTWRQGDYRPMSYKKYISTAADLIECTPEDIIFHRITGTAAPEILLAPIWCARKWSVLNGIEAELRSRGARQGSCFRSRQRTQGTTVANMADTPSLLHS